MDRFQRYKRRFTLIELLAVVALISMLMAVGIPAFARMIRGSKVDESTRSIKLALEQAQMRAASERSYVAVIFPNGIEENSNNADDPVNKVVPYRLGGFRTAYVKKKAGGGYEFSKWVDPEWRNAPAGAMLVKIETGSFSTSDGDVTGCTKKSTDDLEGSSALKEITGVKDDNSNSLKVGKNTAVIFTPYGRIVGGKKLYLLISEAVVNGEDITYPTARQIGAGRTSNYKVLKINNLTGRVEFSE